MMAEGLTRLPSPHLAGVYQVKNTSRAPTCSPPPARKTTESTLNALIVKKFKGAELDLDVGRHWVDQTVVIRVSGTVGRHEDQ